MREPLCVLYCVVFGCLALIHLTRSDVTQHRDNLPKLVPGPELTIIAKYYKVEGKYSSGKEYTGICVIESIEGGKVGYVLLYTVGIAQYKGVGLREGQKLSVSWVVEDGGKVELRGITLYDVDHTGNLSGRWMAFISGNPPGISVGTEKLTRMEK